MRHVPIAEFKDKMSEIVAAAEAGEEIIITRHGRPAARLLAVEQPPEALRAQREAAWEKLTAIREAMRARGITATSEEMIAWKNEGRR